MDFIVFRHARYRHGAAFASWFPVLLWTEGHFSGLRYRMTKYRIIRASPLVCWFGVWRSCSYYILAAYKWTRGEEDPRRRCRLITNFKRLMPTVRMNRCLWFTFGPAHPNPRGCLCGGSPPDEDEKHSSCPSPSRRRTTKAQKQFGMGDRLETNIDLKVLKLPND